MSKNIRKIYGWLMIVIFFIVTIVIASGVLGIWWKGLVAMLGLLVAWFWLLVAMKLTTGIWWIGKDK